MDISRLYTVHQRVKPTFTGDYTEGELESRFEPVARVDASYLDDVCIACVMSPTQGSQVKKAIRLFNVFNLCDLYL